MLNGFNPTWPASSSRRARRPAGQKQIDPRKTVKPTPRGKYGLAPRDGGQVDRLDLGGRAQLPRLAKPSHLEVYRLVASGQRPNQNSNQTLFTTVDRHALTPGMMRKLYPKLRTTKQWSSLQRKFLPRYLFVLDATATVLLLQRLVALQPPPVAAASQRTVQQHTSNAQQRYQQQEQQPMQTASVSQTPAVHLTAIGVPTSITGAFRARHQALATNNTLEAQPLSMPLNPAAVARGFADAQDERQQFELMLAAVCAAVQPKLSAWDGKQLVELLSLMAQLQCYHAAFVESWFDATASQLAQQPMPCLLASMEALASLRVQPPHRWLECFIAATQDKLGELSLPQLAMLLMHVADLQLQLPATWWQSYHDSSMQQVDNSGSSMQLGEQQAPSAGAVASDSAGQPQKQARQWQRQQQLGPSDPIPAANTSINPTAAIQQSVISRPATDALCSILWTSSYLPGQPMPTAWLNSSLATVLPGVQQQRCSVGAAVLLLHACSIGACSQLPGFDAAIAACLRLVQQRLSKVEGTCLQLLLECLQQVRSQQHLPEGFVGSLEACLTPHVQQQPADMLVRIACVLAACQHTPGLRLLSAYLLTTSRRMSEFSSQDIATIVSSFAALQVVVGNSWVIAVLQQLQQNMEAEQGHAATQMQSIAGRKAGNVFHPALPVTGSLPMSATHAAVAMVLKHAPQIAGDWTAVQMSCQTAVRMLQGCLHAC